MTAPNASTRFIPQVYAIDFGTTNSLLAAACADAVHPPVPLDPGAPDPTVFKRPPCLSRSRLATV